MKTFSELRKVFVQKQNERLPPIPSRLINKPFFLDTTRGVFGVQKPTPVDRAAAMMLARSRWKNAPELHIETLTTKAKKKSVKKHKQKNKLIITEPVKTEIQAEQKLILTAEETWRLLQ